METKSEFWEKSIAYFDNKIKSWEKSKKISGEITKVRYIGDMAYLLNDLSEDGRRIIVDIGTIKSFDSLNGAVQKKDRLEIAWNSEPRLEIKPKEMIIYNFRKDLNYLALIAEEGKLINSDGNFPIDRSYLENVILIHPKGSCYTENYNFRESLMKDLGRNVIPSFKKDLAILN